MNGQMRLHLQDRRPKNLRSVAASVSAPTTIIDAPLF
jgi:hypothetical protein